MFKTTMSSFAHHKVKRSSRERTEHEVEIISRNSELQVFLGGSCNPTTWRQNLAIPYLEMNNITYYNPQIDNWTPEVVELEHRAKQNAQVLLFVIDDQTRATVTLIESAFMAGDDKNIVFVFYPFESHMSCAAEQSSEAYNFYESRQRMMKMKITAEDRISSMCTASSQSSSTISSSLSKTKAIPSAFKSTAHCESECSFSSVNMDPDSADSSMESTRRLARIANCSLRLAGESISVEEFLELKQARSILKNLIDLRKIPTFSDIPQALNYISSHIRGTHPLMDPESGPWCSDEQLLSKIRLRRDITESSKQFTGHNSESLMKDVYLSIDSDDCKIMDTTVIPLLEANGLSYSYMSMKNIVDPQDSIDRSLHGCMQSIEQSKSDRVSSHQLDDDEAYKDQSLRLLPDSLDKARLTIEKEMSALKTSRVLIFVITNKCRGLSIMVLASHFMALLKENVVLCVQYLEEPCTIGGEALSKSAIADYNRGRVYLCDDAIKSRVPVFSTIREAIECCRRKCQKAE